MTAFMSRLSMGDLSTAGAVGDGELEARATGREAGYARPRPRTGT